MFRQLLYGGCCVKFFLFDDFQEEVVKLCLVQFKALVHVVSTTTFIVLIIVVLGGTHWIIVDVGVRNLEFLVLTSKFL